MLLIETKEKISHCENPVPNLFLRGTKIEEAVNEKPGVGGYFRNFWVGMCRW